MGRGEGKLQPKQHGVDFSIVYDFDWVGAGVYTDDRQDYGEIRYVAYGDARARGYVIVFTIRSGIYRIISVRNFGRKDQEVYDGLKRR